MTDFCFVLLYMLGFSKTSIQCGTYYQRFGKDRPTQEVKLKTVETLRLSVRNPNDRSGLDIFVIESNIQEVENQRTSLILSIGGGNVLQIDRVIVPEARIFYGSLEGEEDSLVSVLQTPGKNHRVTFVSQSYKLNTNHPTFIHKRLRLSINYLHLVDHRMMQTEKVVNQNHPPFRNFQNSDSLENDNFPSMDKDGWKDYRYILDQSDFSDVCNPVFRYPYSFGLRCCSEKVLLNSTQCSDRSIRCSYPPCKTGKSLCCPHDYQYDYYYKNSLYCCRLSDLSRQEFLREEDSCQANKICKHLEISQQSFGSCRTTQGFCLKEARTIYSRRTIELHVIVDPEVWNTVVREYSLTNMEAQEEILEIVQDMVLSGGTILKHRSISDKAGFDVVVNKVTIHRDWSNLAEDVSSMDRSCDSILEQVRRMVDKVSSKWEGERTHQDVAVYLSGKDIDKRGCAVQSSICRPNSVVVLKFKLVDFIVTNNVDEPIMDLKNRERRWEVDPNIGMALAHELGHTLGADHKNGFMGDCRYMFDFGLWTPCNMDKVDLLTGNMEKCFLT